MSADRDAHAPADSTTPAVAPDPEPVRRGGRYVHAVEKAIGNWNLLHAEGNVVETGTVVQILAPSAYVAFPDLRHHWNRDLLAAEPEIVSTDPQTLVYRIRPEAVWNDGTPLTADDFVYTHRVQNGFDSPACKVSTHAGYELVESVTASSDGRTVTVVFRKGEYFPDWQAMFSYLHPAHIAARHGDLDTPEGLAAAFQSFNGRPPTWSAGPYAIDDATTDRRIVLVPNPRWYGRVRPALDTVVFEVVDDQSRLLPALRERRIHGMNPQPDAELVAAVAALPGVSHTVGKGFVWDHLDLNVRVPHLRDAVLRRALFTAVDRAAITDATIGRFVPDARPLGSHNFVPGMPDYRDVIAATGQGQGDCTRARRDLAEGGYTLAADGLRAPDGTLVPRLRLRCLAGNRLRTRVAELVAEQWNRIGVRTDVVPMTQLGSVLDTGDYDAVLFGWNANPVRVGPARDMWATGGGMNYGGYSDPEVDRLIGEAAATLDLTEAHELLNRADEEMSRDAYVLPLYQRPTFLAVASEFANIRDNPTNGLVIHNIEEWGVRDTPAHTSEHTPAHTPDRTPAHSLSRTPPEAPPA
ncbi:ABC transporter family substrate-binding protein [Streptomyces genisteinicus]|uniref:ABC transporter family substrate-binding protein n=1 Tax=Streptomyces genisteinicus TaxID=2768068 RepID=A0A7H0I1G0_9ACTN|nr:ABC transporter family substrate-binding protein [Streptomyces genisteinicus]QNP66626.1 ABC transporter family substrate-binding protein [Streptomyces genisteinicus]